jgi:hypothetical protein
VPPSRLTDHPAKEDHQDQTPAAENTCHQTPNPPAKRRSPAKPDNTPGPHRRRPPPPPAAKRARKRPRHRKSAKITGNAAATNTPPPPHAHARRQ